MSTTHDDPIGPIVETAPAAERSVPIKVEQVDTHTTEEDTITDEVKSFRTSGGRRLPCRSSRTASTAFEHPSFVDMITEGINQQDHAGGPTRAWLKNYIRSHYKVDATSMESNFTNAVKHGVKSGLFKFTNMNNTRIILRDDEETESDPDIAPIVQIAAPTKVKKATAPPKAKAKAKTKSVPNRAASTPKMTKRARTTEPKMTKRARTTEPKNTPKGSASNSKTVKAVISSRASTFKSRLAKNTVIKTNFPKLLMLAPKTTKTKASAPKMPSSNKRKPISQDVQDPTEDDDGNNEEEDDGGNDEEEDDDGNNEEEDDGGNDEEEDDDGNNEEEDDDGNNEEEDDDGNNEEEDDDGNDEEEDDDGNNEEEDEEEYTAQEGENVAESATVAPRQIPKIVNRGPTKIALSSGTGQLKGTAVNAARKKKIVKAFARRKAAASAASAQK